jgi:hypothetical protein
MGKHINPVASLPKGSSKIADIDWPVAGARLECFL